MTGHAKYALTRPRISQVLDLALAVPTSEACRAKCLIASQDGKIFNLVSASIATIGTIVTDERAIAEKEEVRI